ncbi:MAG: thiamine phosphate synthase [Deltaproteobacteria bacterium]|nr:thiamine phosphate synthase [Deltaproteobacteria bacterium]
MSQELDLSLYLITDRKLACGRPMEAVVQEAIDGGITALQLREKHCEGGDFLKMALRLREITAEAGIPLIINDRIDVALAADADGVHLGQTDIPCEYARRLLGPEAIIGLSVTNVEQARRAQQLDLTYIGVGPIFFTMTKENGRSPIGFEGLRAISQESTHRIVAIGGIKRVSVKEAIEQGAEGVAVVSAIMAAADPRIAAQELLNSVRAARSSGKQL